MAEPSCFVYMLECADGSLYTGWTNRLAQRVRAHNSGRGAKYTRSRRPVRLVYWEALPDKSSALRRELALKALDRAGKLALVHASAPAAIPAQHGEEKKTMEQKPRLILDVDTGSDDAVAILMAVLSGGFEILGLTVTQGNRPLANCVENTLRVLRLCGREDIPVYPGCPAPMVRNLTPGRGANNPGGGIEAVVDGRTYTIHPASLDLPASRAKPQEKHACSFLIEAVKASPDPVTLVTVAPPTNLGMAFRMDPSIRDNVAEVVFMGGSVGRGNVTPVAEANFFHDPEAAKIVMDSGVKCTFITLNATHSAELTLGDADELEALGTPAGKFAAEIIRLRAEASKAMGWSDGKSDAIHDALAIAWLLDPSVITDLRRQRCNMDISGGFADGQLIVDWAARDDETANCYVSYGADHDRFFRLLVDCCKRG